MPTCRGKRFTDASLLGLARIETIRHMALYDTAVTDDGVAAFAGRARRLTSFHMSSRLLTDRGLGAALANCPITNLQIHDAAGVTDASVPAIAAHEGVQELYLNGTSITDAAAERLAGMPALWSFCADGTRLTDAALRHVGTMPELRLLSLCRTGVRGHGLRELAHIDGLDVYLDDCRVGDNGLHASLGAMTRLRRISLSGTDVTDAALAAVGACRELEDLRLNDTGVTDATVERLLELPGLDTVYLERTGATREGLARLRAAKPDLTVYADDRGA